MPDAVPDKAGHDPHNSQPKRQQQSRLRSSANVSQHVARVVSRGSKSPDAAASNWEMLQKSRKEKRPHRLEGFFDRQAEELLLRIPPTGGKSVTPCSRALADPCGPLRLRLFTLDIQVHRGIVHRENGQQPTKYSEPGLHRSTGNAALHVLALASICSARGMLFECARLDHDLPQHVNPASGTCKSGGSHSTCSSTRATEEAKAEQQKGCRRGSCPSPAAPAAKSSSPGSSSMKSAPFHPKRKKAKGALLWILVITTLFEPRLSSLPRGVVKSRIQASFPGPCFEEPEGINEGHTL